MKYYKLDITGSEDFCVAYKDRYGGKRIYLCRSCTTYFLIAGFDELEGLSLHAYDNPCKITINLVDTNIKSSISLLKGEVFKWDIAPFLTNASEKDFTQPLKTSCSHNWVSSMGFNTIYEDCSICGAKKEEISK